MGVMTRHRALAALVVAVMIALAQPTSAAAAPSATRVQTTQLTGVCPFAEGESKDVKTVLLADKVLLPYFLFDLKDTWTGAVLMPYKVVASGEGLKSRHLLPGEYTRRGPAPKNKVTCDFVGTTPDGDINLEVEGTVIQLPRSSPPR